MSHVVLVTFRAHPEHTAAFLERMRRQAADSLSAEPGCSRFDVCLDPAEPGTIWLYEIYDSPAAFDAHLDSAHFRAFDAAVAPMVAEKTVKILTLDGG